MPNELGNKIVGLLAESIGNFMANAAYKSSCELRKLNPDTISKTDLPPLADQLEILMRSKFGPEAAKQFKEKILKL